MHAYLFTAKFGKTFQEELNKITLVKGGLSSLRQFLATESPLKMLENAYCLTFFLILIFLSRVFGHTRKTSLTRKIRINFKIYCDAHIAQYLKK